VSVVASRCKRVSLQEVSLVVSGLYLLVMVALTWFRPGTQAQYMAIQNILQALPPLLVGLLGLHYAVKTPLLRRRMRIGWTLIGLGCLAWALGDGLWAILESGLGHTVPFPSWPDTGYVLSYAFLFAGLFFLLGQWGSTERIRIMVDSLLIAGSIGILSMYFLVQPLVKTETSAVERWLGVAYPMADLAILFSALLILHVRRLDLPLRRMIMLMSNGLACFFIADSAFFLLTLFDRYRSGAWTDLMWTLGWIFIGSAFVFRRSEFPGQNSRKQDKEPPPPRLIYAIVPYLLAAATTGLVSLCDALDGSISNQTFMSILGLISLIMLRQILLVIQNRRLTERTRRLNTEMSQLIAMQTEYLEELNIEMAERQRIEKELVHHRESLEETVRERTDKLRELNTLLQTEVTERRRAEKEVREELSVRRQIEEALRKSEEQYRMLIEIIPHSVQEIDAGGRINFANRASERMFGYTETELKKMPFFELLAGKEEREQCRQLFSRQTENQPPLKSAVHQGLTKNGQAIWLQVDYNSKRDSEGRVLGLIAIVTDITEQKHLQEQLLRSQKLETVGRLAGGIAHDFNNVLTVVTGYCEMLLARVEESDPTKEAVQEIQKAGRRGAALTQRLRAFSRSQFARPVVLNLNDLIGDMTKMLKLLIGENGHLVFRPAPKLSMVKADPNQLEQVVINLVVNAIDAMPQGGTVFVSTSNIQEDKNFSFHSQAIEAGGYAEIRVCDTGIGMSAEVQAHLFEPFFTTKPKGKGIGLGLAMVHSMVRQSGGHVLVESQPGRGTEIAIRLPRAKGVPAKPESVRKKDDALAGTETILLAEDEEGVLKMTTGILRKMGYHVLPARDGHEALRLSAHFNGHIDLLLTDVMMPGMTGLELAQSMARLRPSTQTLFMSGYSEEMMRQYHVKGSLDPLLRKPFASHELLSAVRAKLTLSEVLA